MNPFAAPTPELDWVCGLIWLIRFDGSDREESLLPRFRSERCGFFAEHLEQGFG